MHYQVNKLKLKSVKAVSDRNIFTKEPESTITIDDPVISYKFRLFLAHSAHSVILKIEKNTTYLELWFSDSGYLGDFSIIHHDKKEWIRDETICIFPSIKGVPEFDFSNISNKYIEIKSDTFQTFYNSKFVVFLLYPALKNEFCWVSVDRFSFGFNSNNELMGIAIENFEEWKTADNTT